MQVGATWLLSALTGGLAGAVLTLLAQHLPRWLARPKLDVEFADNVVGCNVHTPALELSRNMADVAKSLRQRYLRLRVTNRGFSTARTVSAQIVKIVHIGVDSRQTVFDTEVLDLHVSLIHSEAIAALPREAFRFFDLAHVSARQDVTTHEFDVRAVPLRLMGLNLGRGTFEVVVFLSADNAASVTKTVRWKWGGSIDDLGILS